MALSLEKSTGGNASETLSLCQPFTKTFVSQEREGTNHVSPYKNPWYRLKARKQRSYSMPMYPLLRSYDHGPWLMSSHVFEAQVSASKAPATPAAHGREVREAAASCCGNVAGHWAVAGTHHCIEEPFYSVSRRQAEDQGPSTLSRRKEKLSTPELVAQTA